jgi:hypothetical protein
MKLRTIAVVIVVFVMMMLCGRDIAARGTAKIAVRQEKTIPGDVAQSTAGDETRVYSAVFADIFQATQETQIMIVDHTSIGVPPGMWAVTSVKGPDTTKFMAKVAVDAQQDYQLKNKQSVQLPGPCHIAPQCALYNVVDLTGIVGMDKAKMEKGWKEFNKRYPNAPGIFVVSRIGFNRDHTEAVMYAAKACGNLCGDGQYVWLTKRDGAWSVAGQTTVWIA